MSAVALRGVYKRYGAVQALAGCDLDVPLGSIFGLVGPNGAGKTTCIKLVLGIVRDDGGTVTVLGGDPVDPDVRANIGYLPENMQVPRHLDALGFLRSVGRLRGLSRAEVDDAAPRLLERVGLERGAWQRSAAGWSKGMRQRAGMAAALLGAPALLVLDEPTDGIDPLGRSALRQVMREEAARGATVLLNSHLLGESEQLCDRVAVMHRGRIVTSGALSALRARERTSIVMVASEPVASAAQAAGWDVVMRPVATDEAPSGGEPCHLTVSLPSRDPAIVSEALRTLLGAGGLVIEVRQPLRALEDVLAEAVSDAPRHP